MKSIFLILLTILPLFASASDSPISLRFQEMTLTQFIKFYYRELKKENFVLSRELTDNKIPVSVDLNGLPASKLDSVFASIFKANNVLAQNLDGVWFLSVVSDSEMKAALPSLAPPTPPASAASAPLPLPVVPPEDELPPLFYTALNRPADMLAASIGCKAFGQVVFCTGTPKRLEVLSSILAALDVPLSAVELRALVLEVSSDTDTSVGIGGLLDLFKGRLGVSLGPAAAGSTFVRFTLDGGLSAFVKAFEGDSRFQVRSRPSLRLVDGGTARLQVGSDVPIRGATVTRDGFSSTSVEYRPTGLVLNVAARVIGNRVSGQVTQELSSFTRNTSSGIDSPTISRRSITSSIDAVAGEVFMLAGLEDDSSSSARTGIAGLGWTTSRDSTSRNSKLVVLLEFVRVVDHSPGL